jgi:ubiquinone/menaquinone biosynthesis C-methylase UbiE
MDRNKTGITIETYNNIVQEYIAYFKTKDLKGNIQFQSEINYVVSQLKDHDKILDVGTATGDYPKYLTEKCAKDFDVIGIDGAKNMIAIAKENAPKAHFKVIDMRDLAFPTKTFNAILCFATLIHVNDEECIKILDSFDYILKEKGLICINVMELKGEDRKETIEQEPLNPKYSTYFNRYTKQFFRDYFMNKGYEVVKVFDNPLFNPEEVGENFKEINQFSIIVRK